MVHSAIFRQGDPSRPLPAVDLSVRFDVLDQFVRFWSAALVNQQQQHMIADAPCGLWRCTARAARPVLEKAFHKVIGQPSRWLLIDVPERNGHGARRLTQIDDGGYASLHR
jgi:hypothetical protein